LDRSSGLGFSLSRLLLTILKSTSWVCGTNPSNLEEKRTCGLDFGFSRLLLTILKLTSWVRGTNPSTLEGTHLEIQTPMAQDRCTKITSMMKWIRTRRLSAKKFFSWMGKEPAALISPQSAVPDYPQINMLGVWCKSGVPREQKMLTGHLPRVIYDRAYSHIRGEKNLRP